MLYFIDRYTQTNRTTKYQSIKQSPTAQKHITGKCKTLHNYFFAEKKTVFTFYRNAPTVRRQGERASAE